MSYDSEFSKAAGKRIIKKQTNMRVSEDAGVELVEALNEIGGEYAEKAKQLAEHSGRKTIQPQDMRQALRELRH